MKNQTVNIDTKTQGYSELLTNHEARIQSLESNEDRTMNRVADILELNFYEDILPIVTKAITMLVGRRSK